MRTINTFSEIMELAAQSPLFVRWSRGPEMDKAQGRSRDQVSGHYHAGLSCQQVYQDRPSLAAQMLVEYSFLRRKDEEIFGWVFTGEINGTDSDNAPTVDAESITVVARIGDELVAKLRQYNDAYWSHRNYKPKTWAEGQEHINNYPKLENYI